MRAVLPFVLVLFLLAAATLGLAIGLVQAPTVRCGIYKVVDGALGPRVVPLPLSQCPLGAQHSSLGSGGEGQQQ